MNTATQAALGCNMAWEWPDPAAIEQKNYLLISRSAIESSERPTAVVGQSPSGKSRLKTPSGLPLAIRQPFRKKGPTRGRGEGTPEGTRKNGLAGARRKSLESGEDEAFSNRVRWPREILSRRPSGKVG